MEPTPAPAAPGPLMPTLSTTVLLAMAAIGVVVLAAIFGFILFIANLRIDERLWWTGLASMIFAFAFYLMFAATHDRKLARPLAGGFFVIGAGSFYGSIFTGGAGDAGKLVYLVLLFVLVGILPCAVFVIAQDAGHDAILQAMRRTLTEHSQRH